MGGSERMGQPEITQPPWAGLVPAPQHAAPSVQRVRPSPMFTVRQPGLRRHGKGGARVRAACTASGVLVLPAGAD